MVQVMQMPIYCHAHGCSHLDADQDAVLHSLHVGNAPG